ncbi:MAG: biopolymer transporter ExbD [Opitutales bacterium]|nr:biopolymer transporter ExbD [Opitutales bacterium]
MARSFNRKRSLSALNELNVTPLMDLAFSLLIIFMVSAPLLEQSIDLNLPAQEQRASVQKADVEFQVINIDARGNLFWGKQEVSFAELKNQLASLAALPDPNPISLRVDRELKAQVLVDVLDLITLNKLSKISISTVVE